MEMENRIVGKENSHPKINRFIWLEKKARMERREECRRRLREDRELVENAPPFKVIRL